MKSLISRLIAQKSEMVACLRQLVELESPSHNKAALDRLGRHLAAEFARIGGQTRFHAQEQAGDHVQVDFPGAGKPILILGHMDTVWDVGTLASMPFRVASGRAFGPGSFDMKAGIVQAIYAIRALKEFDGRLPRAITILLVTDEEIGSNSSRPVTEALAKKSAAVLVLEPAQGPKGALKTSRKGVGAYHVKVEGWEAHSGLDSDKGASAVLELARQLLVIEKFADRKRGVTVNPGLVRGGTRTNVVAGEATAEVDARVSKSKDIPYLDRKFRSLKPFDKRCKVAVSGGIGRPPMERTKEVVTLFTLARRLARELGWELEEASVGGGSDGSFTAALGIPTLDGLGAVGEGAHARHESVIIAEMPRRAALLARLIESIPG
ncbi:MAG TPA: M20 family metallopeptidase [Terriglobales bacterium]|nr:M20 family metallopeptidase [Terriglobales bacterium]